MLHLQHAASSLHPDAQVLCQGCCLLQVLCAAGALLEVEQHAVSQRPRAMALARLHGVGAPAQLLLANLLQVGQGQGSIAGGVQAQGQAQDGARRSIDVLRPGTFQRIHGGLLRLAGCGRICRAWPCCMAGWAKLAHLRRALGKVTVQLRGIGGTPAHVLLQGPLEQRGQRTAL